MDFGHELWCIGAMDWRTLRERAWDIFQVILLVAFLVLVILIIWQFARLRAHSWDTRRLG